VFIELYRVPAQHYGWLFGANALGLIAASQVNRRLLRKRPAARVLRTASATSLGFAVLLVLIVASGVGGLSGIAFALFGFIACLGFIMPNATALAMAPQGAHAGSAAALLGIVQFGMATLSSVLVGAAQNGSAAPMASVIVIGAAASFVALRCLAR
jgi:DHA1 family bicyclomycin/chloramphenicol resistance-like MFS transporter